MKIYSYRFFNSPEQFEQWQIMNQQYKIHSISPFFNGADIKDKDEVNADMSMRQCIFVVYTKEDNTNIGTA